ncbi:hypothetical protein MKX01_004604 [Papaver californicum]|nr:hypothetical protein MKX01_004604 [Papaver californicum]
MIAACTLPTAFIHFPQWGSMSFPASVGVTEEHYYKSEWTNEEQSKDLHANAMKFAENAKKERGGSYASDTPRRATPSHA